jgi:hypothetical protein
MKKIEALNPDLMKKVFDGSLTVKEMNALKISITDRCNYIVHKIFEIQNGKVDWWDFSNEGGKDGPGGYFDADKYKTDVDFVGEFKGNWDNFYITGSFNTNWLWENFEDGLIKEINEWKEKVAREKEEAKSKKIERENRKKELIKSALAKLTPEECKALGHRKPK